MAKESNKPLVNLSSETRTLINQGIYSLYLLAPNAGVSGATYILYTSKRSFLLDASGGVLGEESPTFKIPVGQAVNYIDAAGVAHSAAKKFA